MKKNEFDIDKWIRSGFESLSNMLMIEHHLELKPILVKSRQWNLTDEIVEEDRLICEWNVGETLTCFQYERLTGHFQASVWLSSAKKDWREGCREDKPVNAESVCVFALNVIVRPDREPPKERRLMVRDDKQSLLFASPYHIDLFDFLMKKFCTFSRNAVKWTKRDYESTIAYVESQQQLLGCCDLIRKGMIADWHKMGKHWTAVESGLSQGSVS